MCRYGLHNYKSHMACFKCRVALKSVSVCPYCHGEMYNMGLDFKAPPKSNIKQWQKVEILYRNGIHFGSCGCSGPGYRPAQLNEVERFLHDYNNERRKSEGEKLLDQFSGTAVQRRPRKPHKR